MGETAAASYVAEFVGTFVLVFTVGCNVLSGQSVWGGVSIACALTVMIYALAKSSGANFNPAVSFALGLNETLPWKEVAMYCLSQVAGGLAAAFSYTVLFKTSFNLGPVGHHTLVQASIAELIYTFMLVFVVLNVAVSKPHSGENQFYGLAIGFVIVAGAYSGGSISGGCFNPAVALGIDISSAHLGFGTCLFYIVAELAGAATAVLLFWVCRPNETSRMNLGECSSEPTENGKQKILYPMSSKLVSEFLGTFMLVTTVGLNVLSNSTAAAFSIAAALMCMIFALGSVSGAHFNPAVTVAILCSGRGVLKPKDAALYILSQVVACICAALTYAGLENGKTFQLKPDSSSWAQALAAEFVFTFVLAFVVLSVATSKSVLSEFFGLAIGMCVTAGGCAIGKISGGSLNPAVSIGISTSHLIGGGIGWHCLIYSCSELLAGACAAGLYMVTHESEYTKEQKNVGYGATSP